MRTSSEAFMKLAIETAKNASFGAHEAEVPVGAIITHNGHAITLAHNMNRGNKDPTAHAEMLAIRTAAKTLNSPYLDECDIYITLEPCIMCAYAIMLAKIKRLYFAAHNTKFGAIESNALIKYWPHKPEIYGGICEKEGSLLLKDFFQRRRGDTENKGEK